MEVSGNTRVVPTLLRVPGRVVPGGVAPGGGGTCVEGSAVTGHVIGYRVVQAGVEIGV